MLWCRSKFKCDEKPYSQMLSNNLLGKNYLNYKKKKDKN
jgi:hypothetical protein